MFSVVRQAMQRLLASSAEKKARTGSILKSAARDELEFLSLGTLCLKRVHPNFFIILLKSSHVLSGLRELPLLHALPNIPMHKSPLGIHEVKLVVQPCPSLCNSRGVGEHADCARYLGQISTRDHGGWLVVDPNLEPCWAPVNKLDRALGLDGGYCCVDILWDHVTPEEEAAGHVLAVPGVALHHRVGWLKAGVGYLSNRELLMVSFLSRNDRSVSYQREVNPRVGDQVSLELSQVHIEGPIKPQRCRD